jgi:hypothetical protein
MYFCCFWHFPSFHKEFKIVYFSHRVGVDVAFFFLKNIKIQKNKKYLDKVTKMQMKKMRDQNVFLVY